MDAAQSDAGNCTAVPTVGAGTVVEGPRAYHGIVFDDEGRLVGGDYEHIFRAPRGGTPQVWATGVGVTEQMARHPSGDVIAVADGRLIRVAPNGAHETLLPEGVNYGVRMGPGGWVYATAYEGIVRVHPQTRAIERFRAEGIAEAAVKVLEFSADYETLFFGVIAGAEGSHLWRWDLDDAYRPTGRPQIFARDVGEGYHDALRMDGCGNLWVTDFNASALYRVTPAGQVQQMRQWAFGDGEMQSMYGHGITWGTGTHGWRADAIYLPMPYNNNKVQEIILGIGPMVRPSR